jgi:alpha-ketoglutarate-dependent taurine dioxygenase
MMEPGVVERAFEGQERAPLVVQPRGRATVEALTELLAHHRHDLRERLAWRGAVLFRGFGVDDPDRLARAVHAFSDGPALPYVGGDTPRTRLAEGVYTSTEAPAGVSIPLHSEMSYLPRHPRHLYFACASEPSRGGESTLADTRAVLAAMAPWVRDRFVARGVRYIQVMRGRSRAFDLLEHVAAASKSWMQVFETDDRDEVAARCDELGLEHEWLSSGHLMTSTVLPAVIFHSLTGEPIWFNQAHLFNFSPRWMGLFYYAGAMALHPFRNTRTHRAEYGDGGTIEPAALAHIHDVLDANTVACRWQRGDLLILDNETTMHGRTAFGGPRRVLVSMTSD